MVVLRTTIVCRARILSSWFAWPTCKNHCLNEFQPQLRNCTRFALKRDLDICDIADWTMQLVTATDRKTVLGSFCMLIIYNGNRMRILPCSFVLFFFLTYCPSRSVMFNRQELDARKKAFENGGLQCTQCRVVDRPRKYL